MDKVQDGQYFLKRLAQLELNYSTYRAMWQELAAYFSPRSCKFLISDVNRKPRFSKKILDSSSVIAVRNFSSGMSSGATNPAQKWFKVAIRNYKTEGDYLVKQWCSDITELFRRIFNASNLYTCLPQCYEQMGVFGISAMAIEKDFENVIHCKVLPVGSYRISKDHRGIVDTLYRVYTETVGNIVDKFGIDNVSDMVKNLYENEQYEKPIEIVHVVEPNQDYDKSSKFSNKKKFISVYFEKTNSEKFLDKAGFGHFPYVVFEATVNGEDVYPSNCPGITALPEVKQLMEQVRDYNKALKKIVSPPLTGPASFKNKKMVDAAASFTPNESTTGGKLEPVYQVDSQVLTIKDAINDQKKVISQIFYNDLFVMLNNSDYTQPRTATELNYRKEEAMAQLAPLLNQVYSGADQIMDVTFEICNDVKVVPEAPPQIQGMEIDIEFVSTLAQTQKASIISSTERFVTFAVNLAQSTGDKTPIMKLNLPEIVDDYADFANIETDNIVPTDEVKAQQAALAKQEQAQQAMSAAQQGSQIVKNMGGVDSSGSDLLNRVGL